MPHGFTSPSATVTTVNATPDFRSGARVWPENAADWVGALGGRGSTPACCAEIAAGAVASRAAVVTKNLREELMETGRKGEGASVPLRYRTRREPEPDRRALPSSNKRESSWGIPFDC